MSSPRCRNSPKLTSQLLVAVLLLLTSTTTITQVLAKGGHYSSAVTDTSGPCLKRCIDIYKNDLAGCDFKFSNSPPSVHERDYCVLGVANSFQGCSATCIPTPAGFPNK
ncbi:MAG: hypothetical protein J3R72DRAFT_445613 [Linnemannia gamsii]|nr:MAG: hypothetical protein J3R72DRAFT_445613 [Linnemannia gamsii]